MSTYHIIDIVLHYAELPNVMMFCQFIVVKTYQEKKPCWYLNGIIHDNFYKKILTCWESYAKAVIYFYEQFHAIQTIIFLLISNALIWRHVIWVSSIWGIYVHSEVMSQKCFKREEVSTCFFWGGDTNLCMRKVVKFPNFRERVFRTPL